ncbi:dyslexia-associated protein [Scleropages formosus]|uniref:Dyslexia-associated protein n=1 Tax=Scleropages formosus TaxID=113540 RepID=A0A0P7TZ01_SCLFO|nr:dyslexia-associated protein [Scleropages formosus]
MTLVEALLRVGPAALQRMHTLAMSKFLPISVVGYFTMLLCSSCTRDFLSMMPVKYATSLPEIQQSSTDSLRLTLERLNMWDWTLRGEIVVQLILERPTSTKLPLDNWPLGSLLLWGRTSVLRRDSEGAQDAPVVTGEESTLESLQSNEAHALWDHLGSIPGRSQENTVEAKPHIVKNFFVVIGRGVPRVPAVGVAAKYDGDVIRCLLHPLPHPPQLVEALLRVGPAALQIGINKFLQEDDIWAVSVEKENQCYTARFDRLRRHQRASVTRAATCPAARYLGNGAARPLATTFSAASARVAAQIRPHALRAAPGAATVSGDEDDDDDDDDDDDAAVPLRPGPGSAQEDGQIHLKGHIPPLQQSRAQRCSHLSAAHVTYSGGALAISFPKAAVGDQCWQGVTFSETIISPNLKSGNILRVPEAPSNAQCAEACCELPSCDLAWFFERRCYVLSCLHSDDCQPRQRPGADSHVTFLRRGLPPALVLQSLVRGQPYAGRWRPLPQPKGAATLKDLALFSGIRDFDDLGPVDAEYPEGYRSMEDSGGVGSEGRAGAEPVKVQQKESSGYLDWPTVLGREGLNLSEAVGGVVDRDSLQDMSPDDLPLHSPSPTDIYEDGVPPTVPSPAHSSVPSLLQDLGVASSQNSAFVLLAQKIQQKVKNGEDFDALPVFLLQNSRLSQNDSSSSSAPPTAPPPNSTSDPTSQGHIRTSLPTETPPPAATTAPPTAAPQQVRTLLVSVGDPVQVTLPLSTVELEASVTPEPQTGTYEYEWSLRRFPPGHRGAIEGQHSKSPKLSGLSAGEYVVKVTVTGDHAYGEALVNITVRPAARVNRPPTAVASPQTQEVLLPASSATIDGSRSTDDAAVVGYRWEQLGGPVLERGIQVDTPSLHLSHLQPGEYAFRFTVTDSEGLADSTVATVKVVKPADHPPVADAGPNQTVSLPSDHVTLYGNRSDDDHAVVDHLWTLDPNSQAKEVTMQGTRTPFLQLSDLREGVYTFKLTVTDSAGQQSSSTAFYFAKVTGAAGSNGAPRAAVGPDRQLTLPVSAAQLNGSASTDDQGITRFHWEVVSGPPGLKIEHADKAIAIATGFRTGSYTFRLTVEDQQGATDSAFLNITVSWQQRDTLRRQIAALLHVPDTDVDLRGLRAASEIRRAPTVLQLCVGSPGKSVAAPQLARRLRTLLLQERADLLLFRALRVEPTVCLLSCSDHGRCDPLTKRCVCEPFWMENPVWRLLQDSESNCGETFINVPLVQMGLQPVSRHPFCSFFAVGDWNILYVIVSSFAGVVLILSVGWACVCCCKRRKRTKVRKKTKYTILDNMDDQERMELRPKYNLKHRSTEHNSSLMMSESEFESDQDTIFTRERGKNRSNGATRNGDAFGTRPVDG